MITSIAQLILFINYFILQAAGLVFLALPSYFDFKSPN